ncbi:MAG: SRPBCC family protein [Oleiphilaceae bacterium]|nr:SRPBCC family protein [Oleiphilaceae bacterium]
MAITINIDIKRDFEVGGDSDAIFDLLADVPASTAYFPKLKKLVDLGDNCYRWEMEEVGIDKYSIQSIYACCYQSDKSRGEIRWTPVKGEGNGLVKGCWKITDAGNGRSKVSFNTEAELTLPFPRLVKMAISPVVKHEFNGLVDTYIRNLQKAFS